MQSADGRKGWDLPLSGQGRKTWLEYVYDGLTLLDELEGSVIRDRDKIEIKG